MKDPSFRNFYADNLYKAVFTFPKFKRNYSKNYKNVQLSFKKHSKSKSDFSSHFFIEPKTIVFDIDETLVYATTNRLEVKQPSSIDDTIFIKMTRFGGMIKAFLSFRPYLVNMLDILRDHFELILYTCGTASYAAAFAEAVERIGGGKRYFDHVLSL